MNKPIAYIPDTGLKTLQDGSWCVANAVKMGDSDIPLYTHPVKELTDAIETLKYLLEVAQEDFKTINSHFVIEQVKQALKELGNE